jgi:hypothetical protein
MSKRYVWRNGEFVDRSTGERMEKPFAGQIVMPTVISDIPAYASPIDGRMITSRSERREDLKRNNCVDARDFPSPTGGKFKNKRFCEKRGLQVSEELR